MNSNVLRETCARKEVEELNSLLIEKIINMYVEVPGDEESCVMLAVLVNERGKSV